MVSKGNVRDISDIKCDLKNNISVFLEGWKKIEDVWDKITPTAQKDITKIYEILLRKRIERTLGKILVMQIVEPMIKNVRKAVESVLGELDKLYENIDIPIKKSGRKAKNLYHDTTLITNNDLQRMYEDEKMSLEEIAKYCNNVSRNMIANRLKSMEVPLKLAKGVDVIPCEMCGTPIRFGGTMCIPSNVYCHKCDPFKNVDCSEKTKKVTKKPSDFTPDCPNCDGKMISKDEVFKSRNTYMCNSCGYTDKR
jgi:predicted RNA-binding Zn-ribbon protein involved in translation (DUF1610 family)